MEEETAEVVIVNVALVAAAGTTTLAGTCAAAVLLLVNVTVAPPVGADPLSVTVPCELVPPTTTVGFTVTDATDTPFVVTAPIVVVGTVAAYLRLRTELKCATMFSPPNIATPPEGNCASAVCSLGTPFTNTSIEVECTAIDSLYHVFKFTAPAATEPNWIAQLLPLLFSHLYTYRLLVVSKSA